MEKLLEEVFKLHCNELELVQNQHRQQIQMLNSNHLEKMANLESKMDKVNEIEALQEEWNKERVSLQNEIAELKEFANVSMIKALSKRLDEEKQENERLKKLVSKNSNTHQSPAKSEHESNPESEPNSQGQDPTTTEPVITPPSSPASLPPNAPLSPRSENGTELVFLTLSDQNYYLDPETNDLYMIEVDEEVGDVVGKLQRVRINHSQYVLNTVTNIYYTIDEYNQPDTEAGSIRNGKAIPKRS